LPLPLPLPLLCLCARHKVVARSRGANVGIQQERLS
jgi:hypothetical protein